MERKKLVLILVGRIGSGKSSLANTLTNSTVFKASRSVSSVTEYCQKYILALAPTTRKTDAKTAAYEEIIVVDTPGLSDPSRDRDELHKEVKQSVDLIKQEYEQEAELFDVRFVIVLVCGTQSRLSEDDLKEFGFLGTIFGLGFYQHTLLAWTHIDLLTDVETTNDSNSTFGANNVPLDVVAAFKGYLQHASQSIQAFVNDVGGGHFIVSNQAQGKCCWLQEKTSVDASQAVTRELASETSLVHEKAELLHLILQSLHRNDISCVASDLQLRGKKARRLRQLEYARRMKDARVAADEHGGSFFADVLYPLVSDLVSFFKRVSISTAREENDSSPEAAGEPEERQKLV